MQGSTWAMWAYATRTSSTKTMSISSSKFNLYRKHRTQEYSSTSLVYLCGLIAINGSIHVSMEWRIGSKCITSAKLRVPQTTHNTYIGKKSKRTMRHLVNKKLPSQTTYYKWMVSMARFLSHTEITVTNLAP